MATDISNALYASAMAPQPAFHPAVDPRRPAPAASKPLPVNPEPETPASVMDAREVQHAVAQMNELTKAMNHRLTFTMDYETNDVIVKVVDAETDKVIKELPPAELQRLHKSIKDAVGLLFDKHI